MSEVNDGRGELDEARASDLQCRTILESITDGFFTLDRDWRVAYADPQAGRTLGCAPGALPGTVIWEQCPGTDGSEFERAYRRVLARLRGLRPRRHPRRADPPRERVEGVAALVRELRLSPRRSRRRQGRGPVGDARLGLASRSSIGRRAKAEARGRADAAGLQPSERSAASTIACASTSKWRRNAARVSLRPKPSVPSVTQRRPGGRKARICSGTART